MGAPLPCGYAVLLESENKRMGESYEGAFHLAPLEAYISGAVPSNQLRVLPTVDFYPSLPSPLKPSLPNPEMDQINELWYMSILHGQGTRRLASSQVWETSDKQL